MMRSILSVTVLLAVAGSVVADNTIAMRVTTTTGAHKVEPLPPQLRAPLDLRLLGNSRTDLKMEWDQIPEASAYLVEWCEGDRCEDFERLACTASFRVGHDHLPRKTEFNYRVRASRDGYCSKRPGNLGVGSPVLEANTL